MAIEAPVSRFRKTNLVIYAAACLVIALWFGYDGYYNQSFIDKHTGEDGRPDSTLVFNRKAPPFLIAAALVFCGYLLVIRRKKLVADENELVLSSGRKIAYDWIEKIDKTYFESKGYFVLTWCSPDGRPANRKISSKQYDNLGAILEHLVAKISSDAATETGRQTDAATTDK